MGGVAWEIPTKKKAGFVAGQGPYASDMPFIQTGNVYAMLAEEPQQQAGGNDLEADKNAPHPEQAHAKTNKTSFGKMIIAFRAESHNALLDQDLFIKSLVTAAAQSEQNFLHMDALDQTAAGLAHEIDDAFPPVDLDALLGV